MGGCGGLGERDISVEVGGMTPGIWMHRVVRLLVRQTKARGRRW